MTVSVRLVTCGVALLLAVPAGTQEKGGLDLYGSYEHLQGWLKPVVEGYRISPETVFAESADRIFVGNNGLTPEAAAPPNMRAFSLKVPGTKVDATFFIVNRQGEVVDRWPQWSDRFLQIHEITINPYDPEKHIWVVDRGTQQVLKFTNDGKSLVMEVGERGVAGVDESHFGRPSDIAFLPDGTFFVSDGYQNHRVMKFDRDGKFLRAWGTEGAGPGQFGLVHSVAVDSQRRVYVVDRGANTNRIQIFDENGRFLDQWTGFRNPARLMLTRDGFVWMTDTVANKFLKFDLDGRLLTTFGTAGDLPGFMDAPHDFSVDPDGNLYVGNIWNQTVDKYVPAKRGDPNRLIAQPLGPQGRGQ